MTSLVLTVVGDDRAGLVAAVADIVDAHDGNWENSELAELAGAFAGVIEVSVAPERVDDLRAALSRVDGLAVAVHAGRGADVGAAADREIELTVLGNDHPGIVREVTATLRGHDLSIDRMTTHTSEAAMFGGRLFEATVIARVPASVDLSDVAADLERLAAEIQVDVIVAE